MSGNYELLTNEWLRADGNKWPGREVLVRWSDGRKEVAMWNHFYWVSQEGIRLNETIGHKITHFYIFERDTDDVL